MSFKTLHTFTINLDKEVTEISTREENGQKITTESKVIKPVPHVFVLKEPSRREKQDLSLFQGVMYNEAINKGLLPKVVMQQKVGKDPHNPLSEDEDRNLATMNARIQELANDYMRLNAVSNDTEDLKERKQKLLVEYLSLQKRVLDINSAYQSVYAYTAENYMQTKTLSWLTLMLTYLKNGDKHEPYFVGGDFAAREAYAADLEDAGNELFRKVLEKLPTFWMLYLFGRANSPEDFKKVEAEWEKQMEADRLIKEQQEKEAAALAATPIPAVESTPPTDTPPVATP